MKRLAVALLMFVALAAPSAAAIDEIAHGTGPGPMVYLFIIDQVQASPDSPYTAKRLDNAVKFSQGKISGFLIRHLVDLQTLIRAQKYAQAKKEAGKLKTMIYGE